MDYVEPLIYLHKKYKLSEGSQKAFLIGFSMGANLMSNALAHIDSTVKSDKPLFQGAIIVQAPIRMWMCYHTIATAANGLFNKALSESLCRLMMSHEPVLKEEVRRVCGVDLQETIELWRQSPSEYMTLRRFDDTFTCPLNGFESPDDYWYKVSCFHTIMQIRTPTLFLNALDDPIIGGDTIEYDRIKSNPYTAIATTAKGGHLGYHEGVFPSSKLWLFEPILAYFQALDGQK